MGDRICPIFVLSSMPRADLPDLGGKEILCDSIVCKRGRCAWWVEARTPKGESMCALKFIALRQ